MKTKAERLMERRHKYVASLAKGRILDIGYADNPNPFLKGEVIGLDMKKVALPRNYSKAFVADFNKLNIKMSGLFDTITALEFIEHIENPVEFFRKCNQFLKKGGLLIISTPTPYYFKTLIGNVLFPKGFSRITDHKHVFAPRILNNVAKTNGFEVLSVKNATSSLPFVNWQLTYVYKKVK